MTVFEGEYSRRIFLSATALASAGAAVPASAKRWMGSDRLALASAAQALPPAWTDAVVLLSGDLSARLQQLRACLASHRPAQLHLFLDGADQLLLDIAARDAGVAMRPAGAAPEAVALVYRQTGKGLFA